MTQNHYSQDRTKHLMITFTLFFDLYHKFHVQTKNDPRIL